MSVRERFKKIRLSKQTKNLAALQKLLGHSRISETMIYAHVLQDDINAEMEIFGAKF